MTDSKIAEKSPAVLDLDAGSHFWCRCGHSKSQPFCDGSHNASGTGLKPLNFETEEKKRVALCRCKRTKKPPYCDGTHRTL